MILASIFVVIQSFAATQADIEARNLLIDKLDKVQSGLAPNDSSKVAVTLRLADLLSERARFEAMNELENGCQNCQAGDADRKKALRLYLEVIEGAPEANRGKVMIQVGHLFQMTSQEQKAIDFYNKVLISEKNSQLMAEAHLALGELYFKKREWEKAETHFYQVQENPTAVSKGLAAYRLAWCAFNSGRTSEAIDKIKKILATPALLNRSGAVGSPIDPQFHEEVAFDFVTFLAKENFKEGNLKILFELSPERTRVHNLQALAAEQERLGKKQESLVAWQFIFPYLAKAEDRLTAQLSMAQMQFDLGQKQEALVTFEKALEFLKDSHQCGSAQCEELRKRARQYVISWHQLEKKNLSENLFRGYQLYTSAFPNDLDMHIYSSQVAEALNKNEEAWNCLQPAIIILTEKKNSDKLESILIKQLELAESSKNDSLELKAIDLYLSKSLKRSKVFEVHYQKAKRAYDASDYASAVEQFHVLAIDKTGSQQLRKQSADLSLDGLVLLKDETRLASWAKEYASIFRESSLEYNKIVQKSILSKSASLVDQDQEQAYRQLLSFDPNQAESEDRGKFFKNKLILAERLKKYSEAQFAADEMLAEKNLSKEDKDFAWARKAYISELLLDFRTALAATEKVEAGISEEDKYLKMAIFADLAGVNSDSYYQKYLSSTKDDEKKQLVAAELVRKSKFPEKALENYKNILEKNSELYIRLGAEIFAKTNSETLLKKLIKEPKYASTASGKLLIRIQFIKKLNLLSEKVPKFKLETGNDQRLVKSIKNWAVGIDQIEELTKQAIQSGDWTSQLISLHLLGAECERFYSDLLSAPVPAGLTAEEEQQYLSLLTTQASPYQAKAATAKLKVDEFWKNSQWEPSLKIAWENRPLRPLTQIEIDSLKKIAPEKTVIFANIQAEVNPQLEQKPTLALVQEARKKVYQNPLDRQALENLLSFERRTENLSMVQYLQTRIDNLDKEVLKGTQ